MTEVDPDPAQGPRQAEDAFRAALSALLCAIATNTLITDAEAEVLSAAMPDDLRDKLWDGLAMLELRDGAA